MRDASHLADAPSTVQRWLAEARPVHRLALADARDDRLYFAQVREDPRLEIEALRPRGGETVVVVGSGGCTALSLVAAGAGRVVAVDVNRAQNHLIELKLAAVRLLTRPAAIAFLGALPIAPAARESAYVTLRPQLSTGARAYWDARRRAVRSGVLSSGVTERFIALIVHAVRLLVHGDQRVAALLACRTLEEQRDFYDRVWNSRRWRLLFDLLLNRAVFRRTYDEAFFRHVENQSFARYFHGAVEHTLTMLPIADNYFVHHMLTGRYPADEPDGVPPYLGACGAAVLAARAQSLMLVDGSFTGWLRQAPARSIHGYALSNICEWMAPPEIDELFAEILRTAAPGARLCLRNFVGWTDLPVAACRSLVVDEELGARLSASDRSAVQRRLVIATVRGGGA